MSDCIFIKALTLETIIGVYERERNMKQPLALDLALYVDTTLPAQSDSIKDAVDYDLVVDSITTLIAESHFNLLESLAAAIAENILQNFSVQKVRLTLYKPQAIDNAETVGVTIERSKLKVK